MNSQIIMDWLDGSSHMIDQANILIKEVAHLKLAKADSYVPVRKPIVEYIL
jgi:hypothetical protein